MHQRLPRTTTPRRDIPFVYHAYRRLIQELGAIDGLSSAILLSTRSLTTIAGPDPARQRAIVERRAIRFQINTRFVDFDSLEARSTQLLLVGVYQQAEAFVDGLRRERLRMGHAWRERRKGEAKFSHLMACLGEGFAVNLKRVGAERWALLEYYRLLRNAWAHLAADKDELDALFETVRGYRQLVRDEYGLEAPNPVDALTYDDYLLATRVTKYLATDWCRLAAPSTADELIALLKHQTRIAGPGFHAVIDNRSDPRKLRGGLSGWLLQDYGYPITRYPDIEAGVIAWALALPNKDERRAAGVKTMAQFFALTEIADDEPDDVDA